MTKSLPGGITGLHRVFDEALAAMAAMATANVAKGHGHVFRLDGPAKIAYKLEDF